MKRNIELLAPGGDLDSIKAAIAAGADAVYCGLNKFNARNKASNVTFDDLNGIIKLAHKHKCSVFLTLNIIILESEIPYLFKTLNMLVNTDVDGVIVQDLGLFYILTEYFKDLKIHASTQVTTHNVGQILFLNTLSAIRVNLSRELNISEIKELTYAAHQQQIQTEVFVHGSYCIGFSGMCYISSVMGGNSGNRGSCSQPCRDRYVTTKAGKDYPLNLKDNSAYLDLEKLSDARVDSLKIEGRMKQFHYVYTVVKSWRKQLDMYQDGESLSHDRSDLYKVFNRDFSNSYLMDTIDKNMFIDNPRDHSVTHFTDLMGDSSAETLKLMKSELYQEKTDIRNMVKHKIRHFSTLKTPLNIMFSGDINSPLIITVKTPESLFSVISKTDLVQAGKYSVDKNSITENFKSLSNTRFLIHKIDLKDLQENLFIPFKELRSLKNDISFLLNGSKKEIKPMEVPRLNQNRIIHKQPSLSVLISSREDVSLCNETSADIYFRLPNCLKKNASDLIQLFKENKKLIPWFPTILTGENFSVAVDFLLQTKPHKHIITNNTGIAYKAQESGIPWIAGPYLNVTNSFSLLCLKEKFNCSGSFISNEIHKGQIKRITAPDHFRLFYSIYHPILLLSSRQCLFHQTTGCKKSTLEPDCIDSCEKFTSLTNMKGNSFIISKQRGNYHSIYHQTDFLNTGVMTDLPGFFSDYLIDLRDLNTKTKKEMNKTGIINLFTDLISGKNDSAVKISQMIHPTINSPYQKGL